MKTESRSGEECELRKQNRLLWSINILLAIIITMMCLGSAARLLEHPSPHATGVETLGRQKICRPCVTDKDCRVSHDLRDPLEQLLDPASPQLTCRASRCTLSAASIDPCKPALEESLAHVASRKLLQVIEGRPRRLKRSRGDHQKYFSTRGLNTLHRFTGHNYLNVHSHDTEEG